MSLSRAALFLLIGALALGASAPAAVARASAVVPTAADLAAALPQLRTVRMGLILSMAGTPFYVARERGYLAAENIDLQFEPVQVTSESIAQVGTGADVERRRLRRLEPRTRRPDQVPARHNVRKRRLARAIRHRLGDHHVAVDRDQLDVDARYVDRTFEHRDGRDDAAGRDLADRRGGRNLLSDIRGCAGTAGQPDQEKCGDHSECF